jgi:hypothetical protein
LTVCVYSSSIFERCSEIREQQKSVGVDSRWGSPFYDLKPCARSKFATLKPNKDIYHEDTIVVPAKDSGIAAHHQAIWVRLRSDVVIRVNGGRKPSPDVEVTEMRSGTPTFRQKLFFLLIIVCFSVSYTAFMGL